MATHDYEIANGTGAAVRSDLNNALAAIVSNNSSASAPSPTTAYMWWADTNTNQLKIRNSANNGWITLMELDGTFLMENGTEGAPSISFRDDKDTGIFKPGGNVFAISAGGNERIRFGSAEVAVNEGSDDVDFRVESNGHGHMLFVDGGNNRVGVKVTTPSSTFHVGGTCRVGVDDDSNAVLEIGAGATDNRNAILDFVGDTTYTDYGLRIIRTNSGANASSIIEHRGTGAFGMKTREAGPLAFSTNNSERIRVTNDGKVGIGLTSPNELFHVGGTANIGATTGSAILKVGSGATENRYAYVDLVGDTTYTGFGLRLIRNNSGANTTSVLVHRGTGALQINSQDAGNIQFLTNNTERARFQNNGHMGIGTTSASAKLDVSGDAIFGNKSSGNSEGGQITLRAKNGSTGLANFDVDGADDIRLFTTTNNTDFKIGQLSGSGTKLLFYTAGSERYRVDGSGNILIHQTTQTQPGAGNNTTGASFTFTSGDGTSFFVSRSNNVAAHFNRFQDGSVVSIASAGNTEGGISVSGSTVSFDGAHLSRWSQLAGNAERIEILRGSVLSNLDEMCEWGEEDNEQLNRMKVSDVEGDVNVAGVFQAWDDDDDTYTNDFYCAMTGDFIIRIAQGTTVARGDLLMSAGDGTAKPQDDDIVRSKTIAKVTSTTVSTTYADGSYCVPCVLMAC